MSIRETIGEFRKTPAAAKTGAVLSSLFIIAGCGESGDGIAECPSPEYYRDHAPVKRAEVLDDMKFGTFALRAQIGLDGSKNTVALSDIASKLRPAAEDVFPVDQKASVSGDEVVLLVGDSQTDTKLNEISELVCSGNGGEYFPTSEVSQAYADFSTAGIDVSE